MNVTSHTAACRIPKLDPFHPHAMKLVKDLSDPLRCKTEQRATLSGGVLNITGKQHYIQPVAIMVRAITKCI